MIYTAFLVSSLLLVGSLTIINAQGSYYLAVDIAGGSPLQNLQCLKSSNYLTVFVQAYGPDNGGSINKYAASTLISANQAGLATEAYVLPSTTTKSFQQQFNEAYNNLVSGGLKVQTLWLQVTNPINWGNNVQSNVNDIQSFIYQATATGVTVGIYTNWYDWKQITGDVAGFYNLKLWNWNAYGPGIYAESVPSFDDFRTFGGWGNPVIKQFAQNESLCGLTVNRNVLTDSLLQAVQKDVHVVGGFV